MHPQYHRILIILLAISFRYFVAGEMIPFSFNWNDQSQNITNMSDSLHQPAGRFGRVTISDDGHYQLNGQRIRFFGANIVADNCFPSKNLANDIAQRYVRFGFNAVRFHHMDNSWTTSILDYEKGNSLDLNPDVLDRLDYFYAALKNAGVYINFNLLNARVFFSNDGLPDADSIPWKEQAILAFFHDGARNLHKDYAQKLLTHVNPYTQLAYVDDPSLAFVEVNNENGLIHQWNGRALDNLPEVYEQALTLKWNEWLQTKFQSDDQLYESWGTISEPLTANMIQDGSFVNHNGWNLELHGSAKANFSIEDTFNGQNAAKIEVTETSSQDWHIQFNQAGLTIEEGQIYTLSYWIKGDVGKNIHISIMQAHSPYQVLDYSKLVSLTADWTQHTQTFVARKSDENARFNVGSLANSKGVVYLANVELRKGGQLGVFPSGVSLVNGNVPIFKTEKKGTSQAMTDWYDFMRSLEIDYWSDMKAFIQSIGYSGIQWGTTIMNSPPSVQSVFDASDSHAYWMHPHFTNGDWNPVHWTVGNQPMVNDTDGGVISTLAWQRIKGLPHNVTEYQHCSPNTYSSDAGLFAAIYGSLQDWDGIYLFDYGGGASRWDRGYFSSFFDIDQHPAKLVNASIGSLIFRRFDIPEADQEIVIPFGQNTELNVLSNHGGFWNVGDARHLELGSHLPLMHRVSMDLSLELSSTNIDFPQAPGNNIFTSDNKSITWDLSDASNGVVTVSSHKIKSVIGFDADRSFDLGGVVITPGNSEQGWSVISVLMKEGVGFSQLNQGATGIIAATGKTENTNMGWKDSTKTSVGQEWGQAPTLVENVPATITFAAPSKHIKVWSLDQNGQRASSLEVLAAGANSYFQLGGSNGSLWYEFEVTSF